MRPIWTIVAVTVLLTGCGGTETPSAGSHASATDSGAVTLAQFETHAAATARRLTPVWDALTAAVQQQGEQAMAQGARDLEDITGTELDWLNGLTTPPDCWYRAWSYYHQTISLYNSVAGNYADYLRTHDRTLLDLAVDSIKEGNSSLTQARRFMTAGEAACP